MTRKELEKLELALDKAIEKCMKFDKCPPITCINFIMVITMFVKNVGKSIL